MDWVLMLAIAWATFVTLEWRHEKRIKELHFHMLLELDQQYGRLEPSGSILDYRTRAKWRESHPLPEIQKQGWLS